MKYILINYLSSLTFLALGMWVINQHFRIDLHPLRLFGRVFRRGKGVPQREYLRTMECCPRQKLRDASGIAASRDFKKILELARDSRFSQSLLDLFIRDLYSEGSAVCAYTGKPHPSEREMTLLEYLGSLAISNDILFHSKIMRKMSPDLLDFFISTIAPDAPTMVYFASESIGFNGIFHLKPRRMDGLTKFLLDSKMSSEVRRDSFWKFVESKPKRASLNTSIDSNTILKPLIPLLPYLTYDDIYRLAQSDSPRIRDLAKSSPLLQEEDKVMIILLDNDPKAETF